MWAQRCMHEASLHEQNCLITLTYRETDGNVNKRDLQKFFKRLRRRIEPTRIRYFACGEYGGQRGRPHYHIVCFGWFPPDAKFVTTKKGVDYYGSKFLEEVWQSDEEFRQGYRKGGFVSVADINFKACRYCCKYLQKLDKREHEVKPFTVMSRKPGIGANFVSEDMIADGMMYLDGKILPIPKFYIDKLKQRGYNVDILKAKREYIYRNKTGALNSDSAVDSARRRGIILEERLYKMR